MWQFNLLLFLPTTTVADGITRFVFILSTFLQTYDEEDQQYIQMPSAQRAVHLATLKGVQQQEGSLAPRSSPTGDPAMAAEALKR